MKQSKNFRIFVLIVLLAVIAGVVTFLLKDAEQQKVLTAVDKYGGWISLKSPYNTKSVEFYNDPVNWKETEQLVGQTSLKFSSQNKFVCEWKPVQSRNKFILVVTNCAELIGDQNEIRSLYILYKIGTDGNIESFFVPVGNDYVELVEPFVKGPEDSELSQARTENLELRLASANEIPPLVFDGQGLLK